jgi:GTP-binding protein
LSFLRQKYNPFGGPNGGDGGDGGHVCLVCDDNISDLVAYQFQPQWKAQPGLPGKGSQKSGKSGDDRTLALPPGTQVYNVETGDCVVELLEKGQKVKLLEGGKGGKGNVNFKSSTNQAPQRADPGTPGEQGHFRLVLKTIATVGLVGFPNAGKSSLTNALTASNRKTAPYPFTTLNPSVAILHYPDVYKRLSVADIPGLIDGAHENRGLGHRFLRHIERCKVLLFVIDMAAEDGRNPLEDYRTLRKELTSYAPELDSKPFLVAANKLDLPEAAEHLKAFKAAFDVPLYPISCASEEGLPELIAAMEPYAVY